MKLIKKLRFLLLAALMLALLPLAFSGLTPEKAAAESGNLLKNPGFSGGMTYWTGSWGNGGSDAYDAAVSHTNDGSGSLKITGDDFINRNRTQTIALTGGKKYLVSGYIKIEKMVHSGAANCGAYFSFGDALGHACGKMDGSTNGEDWARYQTEFIPAESGNYTLECRLWGASGTVWFDDLSITVVKGEEPQPIPEAPAPDATFAPVAVKAVRKTGLYTDFTTMKVVGALAKNVYVVADGVKTVNGTEYRRVTAYFNGKAQVGYVKSSDLKADESLKIATLSKAADALDANRKIAATLSAGDKIVCVSGSGDTIKTYADSRYCVLHSVPAAAAATADGGTLTDMYTLNVSIKNPACGTIEGIGAGENSYADGTVLFFTVTANEGYAFRIAEKGGIFTRGNNAFSLTMTENATLTVEFYPILNEELLPAFAVGQAPAFNGSWLSGKTTTSVTNPGSSQISGGAFRMENETRSHATYNYTVALKPHATYRMTVWLRYDLTAADVGGCGTWLQLSGDGVPFIRLGAEFKGEKSSGWTKYERDFSVDSEVVAAVAFQLWGAQGYTEFAGASLKAVSKTTFTKTYKAETGGAVSTEKVAGTYGETFQVLACPITGYEFVSWSDGVTTPYRTEKMDKNETLTATFRKIKQAQALKADLPQEDGGSSAIAASAEQIAADASDYAERSAAPGNASAAASGNPAAAMSDGAHLPAGPENMPAEREAKNVLFPKKTGLSEEDLSE